MLHFKKEAALSVRSDSTHQGVGKRNIRGFGTSPGGFRQVAWCFLQPFLEKERHEVRGKLGEKEKF